MEDIRSDVMYLEHIHRYQWVARLTRGFVVDVACGEGYGGDIIASNELVTKYRGIDSSIEAIQSAKKSLPKNKKKISFEIGSIFDMKIDSKTVDTVVSLETLEHLTYPQKAIFEIKRILKSDGVFIGSVPTSEMEDLCTKFYGSNEYHVQKFSLSDIEKFLSTYFKYFVIFKAETNIGSLFSFVSGTKQVSRSQEIEESLDRKGVSLGSFLFVASDNEAVFSEINKNSFYSGVNFTQYDGDSRIPLVQAYKKAEKMVLERDRLLRKRSVSYRILSLIRLLRK